ncbi:hypothetical protein OE88DRAFT_1809812 [Heliocybe sulcata]|uniref:F-box domain-containing protein n=1 Tax=Heliocybe sulcata TaxID=5364 RepID=A0A5C3MV06_9AGAM|nr:hypothetical protein OE88DRAFT_1809812 [Heliocybe sulcata]
MSLDQVPMAAFAFNSLPTEILTYIFSLALDTIDPAPYTQTSFLLSVSAVCGQWRVAALESPRLWVNVGCDLYNSKPGHGNLLYMHLLRSKMFPVNLFLHGTQPWNTAQWKMDTNMRILTSHVQKWRRLVLKCDFITACLALRFLYPFGACLDSLKSLDVLPIWGSLQPGEYEPCPPFLAILEQSRAWLAPALTELHIGLRLPPKWYRFFALPKLTKLVFSYDSRLQHPLIWEELALVLKLCTHLEHLTIAAPIAAVRPFRGPLVGLVLRTLQTLELFLGCCHFPDSQSTMRIMLGNVSYPKLERLHLSHMPDLGWSYAQVIPERYANLQTLVFIHRCTVCEFCGRISIPFIRLFPSLTHLHFGGDYQLEAVLTTLISSIRMSKIMSTSWMPKLRDLAFLLYHIPGGKELRAQLEMLKTFLKLHGGIEELHLWSQSGDGAQDLWQHLSVETGSSD